MGGVNRTSRSDSWYPPGRLYDLALGRMLAGLRKRVEREIVSGDLYPWLDVCCGTGSQLRNIGKKRLGVPGDRREGQSESPGRAGLSIGLDKSFGMVRYAAARAPGVPFVSGDAALLPVKDGSVRAVSISFGLHEKKPETRLAMIAEVRRVLAAGGRLIAVDFEPPWNARSTAGALFTRAVECLAVGEHYRNGREFLRRGGLRAFLRESGFAEVVRRDIATGSIGIVVADPVDGMR